LVRALDCDSKCRGFEPRRSPQSLNLKKIMTSWHALLIGLLQGLTEFLPISSSSHLKLAKHLLGIENNQNQVIFDLACHLGTLVALLLFLRKDIRGLFKQEERKKTSLLFLAMIPLVPFYFLLKPVREFATQHNLLGFCLILTAGILFAGNRWRVKKSYSASSNALWIGTMQATALIPGISRSASTISCARVLGWSARDAVRFSFLLSIPTIIGGNCLELLRLTLVSGFSPTLSFSSCLIGFLSSCGLGMMVIGYAIRLLEKGNLKPFAWYCLSLGILMSIFLNG
jgi:undecaprenyl-diphosphatase